MCNRCNDRRSPARSLVVVVSLSLLALVGCGRQQTSESPVKDESPQPTLSLPSVPADAYLQQVLRRYRSATHYRDEGEVRLAVEIDGSVQRFTAPMHVLLDGPMLWVAAYDGRIWTDDRQTLGWVHDEKTRHHDSQVVVDETASPNGRPELPRLLKEPLLREKVVAGLGGPPPQLEWLLESDPMAKLFDGKQAQIGYVGVQTRDEVEHVVVEAVADNERYRFWIDGNASLIRSVDLPISLAEDSPSTPSGWQVRSLELRLPGGTFTPPTERATLEAMRYSNVPPQPKFVRAMVPLPPPPPHRMIGRRLESFQAKDITGRWSVTPLGAGNDLTLFTMITSDGEGAALLQLLPLIQNQVPATLRNRFDIVAFVDERFVPQSASPFIPVLDLDGRISKRIGLGPGAACLVERQGRVLWVADSPQWIDPASVASVLIDSASGIDVPTRIHDAWSADQAAYAQKLREMSVKTP
ncbi:MAG: hypothetical protein AAFX06_20490 [Planctomycetota bacterium]